MSRHSPRRRGAEKVAAEAPLWRLVRPFQATIEHDWIPGALLLVAAATALVWANSRWAESYFALFERHAVVDLIALRIDFSLHEWINDGLMVLFFFLAGLEIKAEFVHGELSEPRRAALPVAAALGGMVVPALIYYGFTAGTASARGWGVPMATDIAFAVGVLALLGRRAPLSLRVFLLALAIADDIGSILVIAFFYTEQIAGGQLLLAGFWIATWALMWRLGVDGIIPFLVVGLLAWLAVHESGVHATIAGVLLGLLTPARPRVALEELEARAHEAVPKLRKAVRESHPEAAEEIVGELGTLARLSESPVERFQREIAPWSNFVVLPLFALANAGVALDASTGAGALLRPVALGILFGLLIGKPLGIVGMSWLACRMGLARRPEGISWRQMIGVGILGGIGFTVALFVAQLAFAGPEAGRALVEAKLGILAGSILAGGLGLVVLRLGPENQKRDQ